MCQLPPGDPLEVMLWKSRRPRLNVKVPALQVGPWRFPVYQLREVDR